MADLKDNFREWLIQQGTNLIKFQPKNKDGSNARAQFQKGYTRIDPAFPSPTITSDSGQIGGLATIHFGRPLRITTAAKNNYYKITLRGGFDHLFFCALFVYFYFYLFGNS